MRITLMGLLMLLSGLPVTADSILVEAESFSDKGGWSVDQQFTDLMGSPYLLAHGFGKPVGEASTEIRSSEGGRHHIYVRTFNWTSPWHQGEGPGKFLLKVNGGTLGKALGADGSRWMWQYAGSANLKKGGNKLSLKDLTGFDGRCDAVYITDDKSDVPPEGGVELAAFRRLKAGLEGDAVVTKSYDFVVIGGGIAGMCAAATAARLGCKVALVNDRPILGGNNSSEVRVHLGGHIEMGPNKGLGRMIREFGHSRSGNAKPADYYEDAQKDSFIRAEKNIDFFPCNRAVSVTKNGDAIESVTIRHVETGKEQCLKATLFSDCTGDGTIGYLAGADFLMGRESRSEFGEPLAPEFPDSLTMGSSIQWYSEQGNKHVRFPEFSYGISFNDLNCEKVTMGEWKWETGIGFNPVDDAERIRDYGLLVIYSNWSYLKNHLKDNGEYKNCYLSWVGYISGKRESRRLLGDYILKQDDIDKNVFHEDASFTTTWSLDLHFPDSVNASRFPGGAFKAATNHIFIHPYAVPYRCLYSRNVSNLFMAGRDISVTHVALGTVRVMRTTGMMGEVVGMAAALCKKYSDSPRGIYRHHLKELKDIMQVGAGRKNVPDNQNFNNPNELLSVPRGLMQK